jgi:phosphopantetheinyl transferase
MDSMGMVVERVTGAQKVRYNVRTAVELPEPIWDYVRENPRQTEIKQLLGVDDKLVLAHIRISIVKGALESDEEILLKEQLSRSEIDLFYSLKHPKRRLEWLAGRIVAKGAVRIYRDSNLLPASSIKIERSKNNKPYVVIDNEETLSSPPYISISHSSDMSVSVASRVPGVGIDVEEISGSFLKIADEFSTEEEVELVRKCSMFNRAISLSIIWVIKEASIKAIGPEICSMKELILVEARKQGIYIVCDLFHTNAGRLRSVTFHHNEYVYAVSLLLKASREQHTKYGGN